MPELSDIDLKVHIPSIGLVNGLSGGKKGFKVIQILKQLNIQAFNLIDLSKDTNYFNQFVDTFHDILNKTSELENKFGFSMRPRVFICGGDGTISWALSFLDRALESDKIKTHYVTNANKKNIINSYGANFNENLVEKEIKNKSQHNNNNNNNKDISNASIIINNNNDNEKKEEEEQTNKMAEIDKDKKVTQEELMEEKTLKKNESIIQQIIDFNNPSYFNDLKNIYQLPNAPCIVLIPLGTGNDLSRCLGTGYYYPHSKNLSKLVNEYTSLLSLSNIKYTKLDRWRLNFYDEFNNTINTPTQSMLCYLSIGYTANITLNFQNKRCKYPENFNHPYKNKLQYIYSGLESITHEFIDSDIDLLNNKIRLLVDDQEILLPDDTHSIIISNLSSMANGTDFWGMDKISKKKKWKKPSLGDGILEITSSKGIQKFLQLKMGISSHDHRLGQGQKITIILNNDLPIQIDGEAWVQKKGKIDINLFNQIPSIIGNLSQPRGLFPIH